MPSLAAAAVETAERLARDVGRVPAWQHVFRLAQAVQGLPEALLTFQTDPEVFRPAVSAFCRLLARPDQDAAWGEFCETWHKVREPGGQGALSAAFLEAQLRPVTLRPPVSKFGTTFAGVVSLAYHLQGYIDGPICLPVVALGRLFDVAPRTVSALLSLAARHHLLLPEDETWSYEKRRAKTWRFNLTSDLYAPPEGHVAKPPRKPPPDLARTAAVLAHFAQRYAEAEGKAYRPRARDEKELTSIPADYTTDRLFRFIDYYFAERDPDADDFDAWVAKKPASVRQFLDRFNAYPARDAAAEPLDSRGSSD